MSNKKRYERFKVKKLMLRMTLILFVMTLIVGLISYANTPEIDKILRSSDYNHLSGSVKEYIKTNYQETGTILKTSKNKVENKPYLNPLYEDYLNLSDEEKSKVAYVPAVTVIDFVPTEEVIESDSSSYDLRDYDLVTPVRNQGNFGLCWAFATASTLETHIMKKNNTTYDPDTTQLISERQLDYATSSNGIKDYDNEYVSFYERDIGSGANFYIATVALANGISVVDYDWKEYDDTDLEQMELNEVLNYSNSLYEVNETINVPVFYESAYSSSTVETARTQYVKNLKAAIEQFGSIVVSTYYTNYCMHRENGTGSVILDANTSCLSTSDGHAMTVIGWDDNLEYDYCADTKQHVDSTTGCTNIVTGKGAWILKNSWGEKNEPNPYLAYTSDYSQFHIITSSSSREERTWDNNYIVGSNGYAESVAHPLLTVGIKGEEKLNKIKLMTDAVSATYDFSILQADGSMTNTYRVNVTNPGLITLDFSQKNIMISENSMLYVSGDSFIDNISIFTVNSDENQSIDLSKYDGKTIDSYNIRYYSETKNISSNTILDYKLEKVLGNDSTTDVSNLMTVSNNIVAENNINTLLSFDESIEPGNYRITVNNGETELNFADVVFPLRYSLSGTGTEEDPYLITNEDDLNQMRYDLDAYYKLTADIEMSSNWRPIGTYLEPFRGALDGDGHSIIGLTIDEDTSDGVGFISYYVPQHRYQIYDSSKGYVTYNNLSYVTNVTFKDATVSNYGDAGILIGELVYDTSYVPDDVNSSDAATFGIDGVHFIDSSVTSLNGNAGVIVGYVEVHAESWKKPYLNINNTFSNSTISGYYSSGLIGYISDPLLSGSGICLRVSLTNFQNSGVIDPFDEVYVSELAHSPVIGGIYGNANITLENYIINAIFKDVDYNGNFTESKPYYYIGYFDDSISTSLSFNVSNGYYISRFDNYNDADMYINASEAKDMSLYEDWVDFETYWKIETYDSIQRIPVLKDIKFDYTSISDINIKVYDEVSLLDYVTGRNDIEYVQLGQSLFNSSIAEVSYDMVNPNKDSGWYDDISIKALGKGTVTVKVINNYDGFEKDVVINITADKKEKPIITYYNNDGDTILTETQEVSANTSFSLRKNTFTKSGYNFVSWTTISNGRGTVYTDEQVITSGIDEDLRLYAQWESKTYTLKFDANGGTGNMSDLTNIKYQAILSANTFTKKGYDFKEWNTKADGSGTSYADKAIIPVSAFEGAENDTLILYAQWKTEEFTISYNANGGSGTLSGNTVTSGTSIMIKYNIFIRVGHSFKEWNTKADGSGDSYIEGTYIKLTSNLDLYAIWESDFTYSFEDYSVDEVNKYVDLVPANLSVTDFKSKITIGDGITVDVDIGTKNYVYTGSKTKIFKNGSLIAEYTNIVRGDINQDGKISALDYVKVKNHIMKTNVINDAVLSKAADANTDNKVSALDYVRIKNIIMGGTN